MSAHIFGALDGEEFFAIITVSLGTIAVFKWKGKSCSDNEAHLCCLGHGDILVMDGQCQDEFLHCTDPFELIPSKVEENGVWLDGLLDAYIAMIPKTDGDATPLGRRPLSVLPIVYRVSAFARMGQIEDWFRSWVGGGLVYFCS